MKSKVSRINEQNTDLLLIEVELLFESLSENEQKEKIIHYTARCQSEEPPLVGTVICVWNHRLSKADKVGWFPNELPFLRRFMPELDSIVPGRITPYLVNLD
jgi:hypothetical protein